MFLLNLPTMISLAAILTILVGSAQLKAYLKSMCL